MRWMSAGLCSVVTASMHGIALWWVTAGPWKILFLWEGQWSTISILHEDIFVLSLLLFLIWNEWCKCFQVLIKESRACRVCLSIQGAVKTHLITWRDWRAAQKEGGGTLILCRRTWYHGVYSQGTKEAVKAYLDQTGTRSSCHHAWQREKYLAQFFSALQRCHICSYHLMK